MLTTRYKLGDSVLSFFSTIAQFGSAEDIALADLKIELLFPLDETTHKILDGLATLPASPPRLPL